MLLDISNYKWMNLEPVNVLHRHVNKHSLHCWEKFPDHENDCPQEYDTFEKMQLFRSLLLLFFSGQKYVRWRSRYFHQNVDTQVYVSTWFKSQNTLNFAGIAVKPAASLHHNSLYLIKIYWRSSRTFVSISFIHMLGLRTADASCSAV